ncbi:MAG: GTPase HflX [Eubacteriales bacterium]|nr:GTPase HflX [Eubacteriales bacterium]
MFHEFLLAEQKAEKVILLSFQWGSGDIAAARAEASLAELVRLAESADLEIIGESIQQREIIDPAYYAGKGKLIELGQMAKELGADCLVLDAELSGSQMSAIQKLIELKVIDRSILILDIFAARAKTKEGKIQVEIAQLEDLNARLRGSVEWLSRLGGGIGTRGPGETQLETDRRHIQRRLTKLKSQLKGIAKQRENVRKRRQQNEVVTVAVVGYTNAGKSSLINALCDSELYACDRLFASLDPLYRKLEVEGHEIVLMDTVGFVRELPPRLAEAFTATLDEIRTADIILQVTDISDPDREAQIAVVEEQLLKLGCNLKPRIHVMNKLDNNPEAIHERHFFRQSDYLKEIKISVKTGEGLSELRETLVELADMRLLPLNLQLPYGSEKILETIRRYGRIEELSYTEAGYQLRCKLPASQMSVLEAISNS